MQAQPMVRLLGASVMVAIAATGYAADPSTERTTMPDFCSSRAVTCVLPDGAPRNRGVTFSGRGPSSAGPVPGVPGNVPGAPRDAAVSAATGMSVEPNSRTVDRKRASPNSGDTAGWGSSSGKMSADPSRSQLRGSENGDGGAGRR